jgi:nucleoside-diphosphate-sugar epimerase
LAKELPVEMNRILITGANSFIGSNFQKFSKFGDIHEISLLDKMPEEIEFKGYDVVLHLAAIVHQSKKISEELYFKINSDLCLQVAECAKKADVSQFIFMSTVKVYGDRNLKNVLRNEESECNPDDAYGRSKYDAEQKLKKLTDERFVVSIIRTPLVYGNGVKANMYKLIKLVDTLPILPFGKTGNMRSFTFTENLTGYIDRIVEKKVPGVFIAMDETSLSTTELTLTIADCLGKKRIFFRLPGILKRIAALLAPDQVDRLFGSLEFDNSLTRAALNYSPPFSTFEGLKSTVDFYLKNTGKNPVVQDSLFTDNSKL